jgi:hypothetical protein
MEFNQYSCDTFGKEAEVATITAIADETQTSVIDVSVQKVRCDVSSRRLADGNSPSLMLAVHIGVDDALAGQRIGLALVAIQQDSSGFVAKFKEYVAEQGGAVPASFGVSIPEGAVTFEGTRLTGRFSSLQECRVATATSNEVRCCLRRSPRAHRRRPPDMRNAFVVNAGGSTAAVPPVLWELCVQSPKKSWAL